MAGFVWSLLFGDPQTSFGIALFFELFWLDLIPAGTYIPPNSMASTLAALSLAGTLRLDAPSSILLALALTAPLARLFAKVEEFQRSYENRAFSKLMGALEREGGIVSPAPLVVRSIADMALINGLTFALVLAALTAAALALAPKILPLCQGRPLTWAQIWIIGSLGPILSLRFRTAYLALAGASALGVLWFFFQGLAALLPW